MMLVGVGLESFDDGLTLVGGKWTNASINGIASAGGISGNYALFGNGANVLESALLSTEESDECAIGCHVYYPTGTQEDAFTIRFRADGGATLHVYILVTAQGRVQAYLGDGTLLGESEPNVIAHDTWHFMETKVILSDAAGEVEVNVDGENVLFLGGIDTKNGGTATDFDTLSLNGGGGATSMLVDNVYMLNADGGVNDDLLGPLIVEVLIPNGAGDQTDWAAVGAATNWEAVETSDGDTSYVETATATDADTYGFSDLVAAAGAIPGVVLRHLARYDGAVSVNIEQRVRRTATDSDGDTKILSSSYSVFSRIMDEDPIAAAAWSIANVNASQFGQVAV
jgi:hypothetical protein